MTAAVVIGGGVLVNAALNPPVSSFDSAMERLERRLLPSISVESAMPPASIASAEAPLPLAERLPQAAAFPVYGAPADAIDHSGSTLRVEIVSSLEKADNQRANRRWLVDGAERFNQRRERGNDGRRIEVVVRPIPSGLAAQMLAAGSYRPAGYSPASQQWLELLHHNGIAPTLLQPSLVGNRSVIALRGAAWKQTGGGLLAFGPVMERTLAGQLRMGTCNPYLCSPGLDFMHTLLWTTAGHAGTGGALQAAELERSSIQRSLELFQQRVSRIDPTYIEQIEIWQRRPEALDAMVMAEQSYRQLRREPGFEDLLAVPFGADQDSPLVALPWTTGPERQALEHFARFMTSAPQQTLARHQDFGQPSPVPATARPPRADGELLSKVQRLWKQRKDGGRTVYLQLLVDVSGSMSENDQWADAGLSGEQQRQPHGDQRNAGQPFAAVFAGGVRGGAGGTAVPAAAAGVVPAGGVGVDRDLCGAAPDRHRRAQADASFQAQRIPPGADHLRRCAVHRHPDGRGSGGGAVGDRSVRAAGAPSRRGAGPGAPAGRPARRVGFPRFCGQSSGHHCGHYTGSSSPCFIDNGAEVFNR
jgi:hypothetical protein